MTLPATLSQEQFEELDEVIQAEYAQKGETYVLQVEGIKDHPTVTGLQKAYEAEKARAKERSDKLKAFGDATPEDIESLREELSELREGGAGSDDDRVKELQEQINQLREKNKELAPEAKRAKELEGEVEFFRKDQSTRLRREVEGAVASAGVKKESVPVVADHIMARYHARYEQGEEGFSAVVTGDLNGVPGDHELDDFVNGWTRGPGSDYGTPMNKGGSGAETDRRATTSTQGGVKKLQMEGTTVRANPDDIIAGKAAVVQEA